MLFMAAFYKHAYKPALLNQMKSKKKEQRSENI